MYMRTVRSSVYPEKIDQAIRLIAATANAPAHQGFVSGMFTADVPKGTVVTRTLWATKKDAQAFGEAVTRKLQENQELAGMIRSVSRPKTRHVVSVTSASRGGLFDPPTYLRVTTIKPIAGKAAEVDRLFEESVEPAVRTQPGFQQAVFLEDDAGGTREFIGLWNDEVALLETERNGCYQEHMDRLIDLVADPPVREVMPVHLIIPGPATAGYYKLLGMRVYDELFGQGKLDLIEDLFTEDFAETSPSPLPGLPAKGHEAVRAYVTLARAAFPDLYFDVQALYVEGDVGIGHVIMRGTHQGEFLGIPATGREVALPRVEIVRFRDGKIAEHYGIGDTMALLTQLGVAPETGTQAAT